MKYAVSVVDDETRLVWESPEYKTYEEAFDTYKDECKRSGYEVIMYKWENDKWNIIHNRPQHY